MIFAAPGQTLVEAVVQGYPTGLTGTIGFRIRDNAGADTIARTTAGITEDIAGGGEYRTTFTAPTVAGQYTIVWDKGLPVSPSGLATEALVVTSSIIAGAVPSGSDLCTLADVRGQMELTALATELDPEIQALITIASKALMLEVDRELAPVTADATRTFPITGGLVDFAPYDLRTTQTVTLDPNGTPRVLTANSDFYLEPTGGDDFSLYTELLLSHYLVVAPQSLFRFGLAEISVRGAWGFASVPEVAKQACVITVRSWLRRDSARGAYTDPDMNAIAPDPGSYFALPPAARRLVDPLRRHGGVI